MKTNTTTATKPKPTTVKAATSKKQVPTELKEGENPAPTPGENGQQVEPKGSLYNP